MTKTTTTLRWIAAALLVTATVATLQAQTAPTRLQVLSTSVKEDADSAANSLNEMGYGPAEVRQIGDTLKVLTRAYDSYAEANFAKPSLKGKGFPGAFCVAEETGKRKERNAKIFGELADMQHKPAAEIQSNPEAAKQMRDADGLLKQGDRQSARDAYEKIARDFAGTSDAAQAELRCAHMMLKDNSPEADVLNRFERIACGKIPASPDVRLTAMQRCAALYHRGKDLDAAQAAYEAIHEAAPDATGRASAEVEVAGITLEKARNGKAAFAQARQLCDDVLKQFPEASKKTRATAALMRMETHAYENNYHEVLKLEKGFQDEFAQTDEAILARYWVAKAHFETGDAAGAKRMADSILDSGVQSEKRFRGVDVMFASRELGKKAEKALQETKHK